MKKGSTYKNPKLVDRHNSFWMVGMDGMQHVARKPNNNYTCPSTFGSSLQLAPPAILCVRDTNHDRIVLCTTTNDN